jgi:hypothetical protein
LAQMSEDVVFELRSSADRRTNAVEEGSLELNIEQDFERQKDREQTESMLAYRK